MYLKAIKLGNKYYPAQKVEVLYQSKDVSIVKTESGVYTVLTQFLCAELTNEIGLEGLICSY